MKTAKNEPMDTDTVAAWLGDVIPVLPLGAVISIGGILIALGVATVIAALMRTRATDGQPAP